MRLFKPNSMINKYPIVLEYDLSAEDVIRSQYFMSSGRRRTTSSWTPYRVRVLGVVTLYITLSCFILPFRHSILGVLLGPVVSILLLYIYHAFVKPAVYHSRIRRVIPHAIPMRLTILEDGFRLIENHAWLNASWEAFSKVDTENGAIYIVSDPKTFIYIPSRAFPGLPESTQVFEKIKQLQLQYQGIVRGISETETTGSWPPAPRRDQEQTVVPLAGPPMKAESSVTFKLNLSPNERQTYMSMSRRATIRAYAILYGLLVAVSAVVLAISGHKPFDQEASYVLIAVFLLFLLLQQLRQRRALVADASTNQPEVCFTTDFSVVRFDTQTLSLTRGVEELAKVTRYDRWVTCYDGLKNSFVIPPSAFASRADAKTFTQRLSEAIKEAKARQQT